MALEQIIAIIVFVLVLVFVWGVFKKLLKIMLFAVMIILLLIAANTYFIYSDVMDLRENFDVREKKVILVDEDRVLTGILLNEETGFLTSGQLSEFSSYLKSEDYEKILGDSYKLMIFDLEVISDLDDIILEITSDLDEGVDMEYETIAKEHAISVLKSDGDSREKAVLFGAILSGNILSSSNPLFFFSEFKKGNIMVYPETALFKTIKFIPLSFIKDVGEKMFEKTKEKAKTFVVDESENI